MQNDPVKGSDRIRLVCLAFFIFCLFALLIAQFYRIQIVEGEKWTTQAQRQHYFYVKEPFLRGLFYSNTAIKRFNSETPQKLVVDIQKFHLYADPESIPARFRNTVAKNLIGMLDIPKTEEKAFRSNFYRKSRSRKLAMWLDKEERDQLLLWWQPFAKKYRIPRNSLYFVTDYQRSYPFGKLLGQALHTMQNNKDEKTQQAVPTGGLEL